jgi:hypothetical protein
MNLMSQIKQLRWGAGVVVLALSLAGCGRNEIKVYRVAKETAPEPSATMTASAEPAAAPAQAQLTWTLPAGWKEMPPGQMRAASFIAVGKSGLTNDISVIPLPKGGPENDLVNMWRGQLKLAPLDAEAAGKQAEQVTIGSDPGKLFDIVSTDPVIDGTLRGRILVAMTAHGPMSWFFKMTGEDASVREQKPAFIEFLKSIKFSSGAEPAQGADGKSGSSGLGRSPGLAGDPRRADARGEVCRCRRWRRQSGTQHRHRHGRSDRQREPLARSARPGKARRGRREQAGHVD